MWKEPLTTLYVHMDVLINYTWMLGTPMKSKFGELTEDWKYIISTICIFSKCVVGTSYDCVSSWPHRNLPLPNMFDDVSSRDWGLVSCVLSKLVITMLFAFSWWTYEDGPTMDTVNREGHAGLKMALGSQYLFDK